MLLINDFLLRMLYLIQSNYLMNIKKKDMKKIITILKPKKQNDGKKISLIILSSSLIVAVFLYKSFKEIPSPTSSSVWIGDSDFGCWYDILEIDSVNYIAKIKIYHDYDDGVWNEAYYCNDSRSITPFTKQNILNSVLDYDVNTEYIILKGAMNDSLRLCYK